MPLLTALLLIVQVSFAVHAVKTGRDSRWMYFILFVPAIGCLVYFIAEVLPDLRRSRAARQVGSTLAKTIDPMREVRRLKDQLQASDTRGNRLALAQACLDAELAQEAASLYHSCLNGMDATNPDIMRDLARAQFMLGEYRQAKETLERLIQANPDYKSSEGHLLYARSLEALGQTREALAEYEVLARSYPGEEARYRYALLLKQNGDWEQAKQVFEDILARAKHSPKYARKAQKPWVALAKQQLDA